MLKINLKMQEDKLKNRQIMTLKKHLEKMILVLPHPLPPKNVTFIHTFKI